MNRKFWWFHIGEFKINIGMISAVLFGIYLQSKTTYLYFGPFAITIYKE